MTFNLFKKLYDEALKRVTLDAYIAEQSKQGWTEGYDPQEAADVLTKIYKLANAPLKESRQGSRAKFSRQYGIPARTLQNWDLGERVPAPYVKMLIDFAQFNND